MIDSTLLYTKEDKSQDFVHDTFGDFFAAKWLAEDKGNIDKVWSRYINTEFAKSLTTYKGSKSLFGPLGNAFLFYSQMVPDATYLINKMLEESTEIKRPFLNVALHDVIEIAKHANHVSQEILDKLIEESLPKSFGIMCGRAPSTSKLTDLMLEKGFDIVEYCRRISDDEADAYHNAGKCYQSMMFDREDWEIYGLMVPADNKFAHLALQHFKKSVELNPDCANYYIDFADLLMRTGVFKEAAKVLEKGKMFTNDNNVTINAGLRVARSGVYDVWCMD